MEGLFCEHLSMLEGFGEYGMVYYQMICDCDGPILNLIIFVVQLRNLLIPELSKCVASLCHLLRLSAGIDGRTLEGVRGMS